MVTASTRRRAPAASRSSEGGTVADLLKQLGRIPAHRVRLHPVPGTATEADLLAHNDHEATLCELVDGTLVEKPMGMLESDLTTTLIMFLKQFVRRHKLGIVTAPDGTMRLATGNVRLPDVAFIAKTSYPGGKRPTEAIPTLAPDLAVEVLSKSNTKAEMARKLREYFGSGTRLAWLVDPKTRSVRVYTSPTASTRLEGDATLDGGDVLPGFVLPLADLFATDDD